MNQINFSCWLRGFELSKRRFVELLMSSKPAAACDDPREVGLPCHGNHKEGKTRQNQHASWSSCQKCGIRLRYVTKKGQTGATRQMGPEPHLLRLAMTELEKTVPENQMTADIVNGKLMEVKGKLLQMGVPTSTALNLTYEQYLDRLVKMGPSNSAAVEAKEIRTRQMLGYSEETNPNPISMTTRKLDKNEENALKVHLKEERSTPRAKASTSPKPTRRSKVKVEQVEISDDEEEWSKPENMEADTSGNR